MAWDAEAKKLAVKVIGTVESNLKYDAVYYVDPITVGIMQWYGTRAANLLVQIKATPAWVGVASTLDSDLASHDKNDASFWTNRYLTRAEGGSLKNALTSSQGVSIQNAQTLTDFEDYRRVALKADIDVEGHTDVFIFWACMYHQSPKYSKQVLNKAGDNPSLDRLYTMCLNHSWFSKFKTRYTRARDMIRSGDTSGVPDTGVTPDPDDVEDGEPDPPGIGADDDFSNGTQPLKTNISHVMLVGSAIHIVTKSGATFVCNQIGPSSWSPASTTAGSTPVTPPTPNPTPEIPPVTTPEAPGTPPANATEIQKGVVKWMTDREGKFNYSQGDGRNNPDKSGVGDCSSTVRRAYKDVAGIEVGTYTVDQQNYGRRIWINSSYGEAPPESILQLGDLIFYRSSAPFSGRVTHVEMYIGNGKTIGHGGPRYNDKGPTIKNMVRVSSTKVKTIVRRYI